MNLFTLFLSMLKIGALSFGGSYGTIALIRDEFLRKGYLWEDEYLQMVAFSQYNPWSAGITSAVYVGSKSGAVGVIVSLIGFLLPTILIAAIILKVGMKLKDNLIVQRSLNYMNLIATGVLCGVAFIFIFNVLSIDFLVYVAIAGLAFYFNTALGVSPLILIGGGAVIGLIWRA